MQKIVAALGAEFWRVALAIGLVSVATMPLAAQVLRGSIRTLDTSLPIPRVEVSVRDSTGTLLGTAISDDQGFFVVRLFRPVPFSVVARRLGFQVATTDLLRAGVGDTLELQFQLAEVASEQEAIEVTGMEELNKARLDEATRRGWRVYEPEAVAVHRERARDVEQLLRSLGTQILMPRSNRDCFRNPRTNLCMTFILDGQIIGMDGGFVLPSDIYFVAVLSPSQSAVQYGNRAPNGAIAIFTRMRGDRYDVDRLPPHMRPITPPSPGAARPPATPARRPELD
jgi:hypothetical protein